MQFGPSSPTQTNWSAGSPALRSPVALSAADVGVATMAVSAPVAAADPVADVSRAGLTMPVDDFINTFKMPILLSPPRLRKTRAARDKEIEDEDLVPKRSARLAAKSKYREAKPEAQAMKVMMKKLGFEVETELPDEASFDEFQTAFRLPLTPSKREAMQVLFPGQKQRALGAVSAA